MMEKLDVTQSLTFIIWKHFIDEIFNNALFFLIIPHFIERLALKVLHYTIEYCSTRIRSIYFMAAFSIFPCLRFPINQFFLMTYLSIILNKLKTDLFIRLTYSR
jgi:hypothetical protein